jgi:hypothetical protein
MENPLTSLVTMRTPNSRPRTIPAIEPVVVAANSGVSEGRFERRRQRGGNGGGGDGVRLAEGREGLRGQHVRASRHRASRSCQVHRVATEPTFGRPADRARVNRYYDPATGQFLTRDPAVELTGSPYGYVYDNPLSSTDPAGLFGLPPWRLRCPASRHLQPTVRRRPRETSPRPQPVAGHSTVSRLPHPRTDAST